jgi:outer membrane protein assembly factor BamB
VNRLTALLRGLGCVLACGALAASATSCKSTAGTEGAGLANTMGSQGAATPRLALAWRSQVVSWQYWDWQPLEFSQPTVSPDGSELVVGTSRGHVVGLSTLDGRALWSFDSGARVDAKPVFWEDMILVGNDAGVLHGLSAHGDVKWTYQTRAEIDGTVTVAEGRAFVMDGSDILHALDARTGKKLWSYTRTLPDYFTVGGASEISVHEDTVFAGFADGTFVALFIEDGSLQWGRDLTGGARDFVDVDSKAIVFDGMVYAASFAGGLYAMSIDGEGEPVWKRDFGGVTSLQRVGDTLYTSTASRYVLALDAKTGATRWRFRHVENTPTELVVAGDYIVYGGSNVGLFVLDRASGRPLLAFDNRGGFSAPPSFAAGRFYAFSNRGYLYGFDLVVP